MAFYIGNIQAKTTAGSAPSQMACRKPKFLVDPPPEHMWRKFAKYVTGGVTPWSSEIIHRKISSHFSLENFKPFYIGFIGK